MSTSNEKHGENVDQQEASVVPSSDGYPKGIRLVLIMMSLMLGTTLMALDATIISVVTPKITTQFQALGDIGWYGAAYSMLLTAFTPIASNFYKYFNPKYVYLAFIVVFEGKSPDANTNFPQSLIVVQPVPYFARLHQIQLPSSLVELSLVSEQRDYCKVPLVS